MADPLHAVDDALVRLRRLWSPARRRILEPGHEPVDMSSVLVVEACARRSGEVTVGDVARFADVEHSTASRLVDRAERAGLVRRAPSARDARRAAVHLTGAGAALREHALIARRAWLTSTLAAWTSEDVALLAQLLEQFADAVAEVGPPGVPAGER